MRNFGRKIGLLIADDSGQALDLSGFRVAFSVEKTAAETPNTAKIDIWNLCESTAARILSGSLKRIVLQAGYESNAAVIFDGNVIKSTRARTGADVIVSIEAGDGDRAYTYAVVSESVGSGYTDSDVAKAAASGMVDRGAKGVTATDVESGVRYPRGRVLYGPSRKVAREVAKTTDCQWSIQDGRVTFCKVESAAKGKQAFLLSPTSGLVGAPKVDKDGVTASSCLNPVLRIYDPIMIESEFVKGTYKILTVKHDGDTHASVWTTEITGAAIDVSSSKTTQR